MKKTFTTITILILALGLIPLNLANADNTASKLKGKILLQVESNGEAWYVYPDNEKRYYLGRPADAFQVMRNLGLGVSSKDFGSFNGYAPSRLSGKILLKVEDYGKAYYVNPEDLKLHYLGRPADAFQIMRELGLGITNENLRKISIFSKNISLEAIDGAWNLYTNNYFGFSFEIPQKDSSPQQACGVISVNEFEDRVEIVGENDKDECKLWTIYASWVDNEDGVEKMLQERYGSDCKIDEMNTTEQDNVYRATTGLERTEDCFINYITTTYYNKSHNLAVTWSSGQDILFFINEKGAGVHNFKFINDLVYAFPSTGWTIMYPNNWNYKEFDKGVGLAPSNITIEYEAMSHITIKLHQNPDNLSLEEFFSQEDQIHYFEQAEEGVEEITIANIKSKKLKGIGGLLMSNTAILIPKENIIIEFLDHGDRHQSDEIFNNIVDSLKF